MQSEDRPPPPPSPNAWALSKACLATLMLLVCAAWSAVAALRNPYFNPQVLEITPSVLDFGTASQGTMLEGVVQLRNASDHKIQLIELIKSCSCTGAELPCKELAPGESASLPLIISTRKARGTFKPALIVKYRVEGGAEVLQAPLRLTAKVNPSYTVSPSGEIVFPGDRTSVKELAFRAFEESRVHLIRAYCTSNAFRVEFESEEQPQILRLHFDPSKWNRVSTSANLIIQTTCNIQPTVTVPLKVSPLNPLEIL